MQHPTIKDPTLAEISELLHRMESCKTVDTFQWMARDAIKKLRNYAERSELVAETTD